MATNNRAQLTRQPSGRKPQLFNEPVTNRQMSDNRMADFTPIGVISNARTNPKTEPAHVISKFLNLHDKSWTRLANIVCARQRDAA